MLDGPRIGQDLWLTNPQRVVLTKERLRDMLGEHGQVFETATTYRRAVDERLFQLGTARYSALMDTLIQLRQPQLSKKPDEASLSNALTEALPPLSAELLGDVAEALNQLEEDRRQLEEYEALARAVGQFSERYRFYAKTQKRRQARNLRSAQTGFDLASRALNEAREEWKELKLLKREQPTTSKTLQASCAPAAPVCRFLDPIRRMLTRTGLTSRQGKRPGGSATPKRRRRPTPKRRRGSAARARLRTGVTLTKGRPSVPWRRSGKCL